MYREASLNPGVSWRDATSVMAWLVRLIDVVLVVVLGFVTHAWLSSERPMHDVPAPLILGAAFVAHVIFPSVGVYRSWRGGSVIDLLGRVVLAWVLTVVLVFAFLHLWRPDPMPSRLWLLAWASAVGLTLVASRVTLYGLLRFLRRRGWNHRRVVLIGSESGVNELLLRSQKATWSGFDIIATIPLQNPEDAGERVTALELLIDTLDEGSVQELWIAAALRQEPLVREVIERVGHYPVNIRYAPDLFALRLLNHSVSDVLGILMLDLSSTPMTGMNRVIKAVEDRVLAFLILVTISPLLLVIAIAVKLSSPGPVLFKQVRHGWDGREIKVYKFRSMVVHSEPPGECTQATREDCRVTWVGRFLRRTSLDELPQFYNVLQGRMSIVGPRPHAVAHNEYYQDRVDRYLLRNRVKPGITGWAQVNGLRGETDTIEKMQRRVEYDLYYIENWSLWFDLKIIFLTLFRGFSSPNAY